MKASDEKEQEVAKSICYMAYVALKSQRAPFWELWKGWNEQHIYRH